MSALTTAKARALFILAVASLIAGGATRAVKAQTPPETVRLVLREGSKLWIEGDSNLHAWKCDAKSFVPELRLVRPAPTEPPTRVQQARLQVSVADIECGKAAGSKTVLVVEGRKIPEWGRDADYFVRHLLELRPILGLNARASGERAKRARRKAG